MIPVSVWCVGHCPIPVALCATLWGGNWVWSDEMTDNDTHSLN